MAGCSGDHSQYQAAVEVAEAKAAEAIGAAEAGHRAALDLMADASQRERYIGIIKDAPMRARLEAYSAGMNKVKVRKGAADSEGPDQAVDDKNDKERKKEMPNAEVAELREQVAAVTHENEQLAMAAVLPLVQEMVSAVPEDRRQAAWDQLSAYTPSEIRGLHSLGMHSRAAASPSIYTASSLLSVPPAQTGMAYQAPAPAPAAEVASARREINPLIPHQGALPRQAPAVAAVDGEFEVQLG